MVNQQFPIHTLTQVIQRMKQYLHIQHHSFLLSPNRIEYFFYFHDVSVCHHCIGIILQNLVSIVRGIEYDRKRIKFGTVQTAIKFLVTATTRDFSFVCDEALEVGTIFKEVKKAGGKLVEDISLFDIYRGPQVGENKKSVSIRVTLRASDRTLTVEEAEKSASKILKAMEQQLGISLRA